MDFTGCGNTLNMQSPQVLQLIMDSLRYWVLEMHVDGFRFDLASALARELYEVDRLGAFFDIIHQDPVLSQVKLIAEPWDVGAGGYQVGNFPVLWTEWNGKYRDAVRRFWRGDGGVVAELATRLAGSSDLYEHERPPAVREHQLHHRARRLHAARPRQLQREAQRGQRRGQPRRREPQPQLELRRRRADRRSGDQRRSASGRSATCWRRCCSRRACRCSAAATSSAARSTATTTPTARTTRSALDALGPDARRSSELPRVHRAAHSHPARAAGAPAPASSSRAAPIRGADVKDIAWLEPNGSEMTDESWNARLRAVPRRAARRATRSTKSTSAGSRSSATRC